MAIGRFAIACSRDSDQSLRATAVRGLRALGTLGLLQLGLSPKRQRSLSSRLYVCGLKAVMKQPLTTTGARGHHRYPTPPHLDGATTAPFDSPPGDNSTAAATELMRQEARAGFVSPPPRAAGPPTKEKPVSRFRNDAVVGLSGEPSKINPAVLSGIGSLARDNVTAGRRDKATQPQAVLSHVGTLRVGTAGNAIEPVKRDPLTRASLSLIHI